jgi:hypothetical protein
MLAETWGRVYPNHVAEVPQILGYPTEEKSRGMNGQAYVYFDYPPNADDPRIVPAANKIPVAERGSVNRVKSFHAEGAHIVCADGAVHFMSNSVQYRVSGSSSGYLIGVWQYLATINGPDKVNPAYLNWR